jgi:hypothetical protein
MMDEFIQTFRIAGNVADIKPIIGKLGTSNPKQIKFDDTNI